MRYLKKERAGIYRLSLFFKITDLLQTLSPED